MAASARSLTDLLRRVPHGRWAVVGYAFVLGLLLYLLVWLAVRDRDDAPTEAGPAPLLSGPSGEPLPGPLAAGEGAATPLPPPDGDAPQLVEETPPPEPTPAPAESAPLPPDIETAPAPATSAVVQAPAPLPGQSPPPRYPPAALRRGESGTVLLHVEVDASGVPVTVQVARRSGSRDLDRAAVEAVSRWRFRPATDADGRPVPGSLAVPVDFTLD